LDNTGVVATSDYDDIDWGEIQFSEIDWTAAADAGTIDWGEIQWNELDNTGVLATSDYDDIDWGEIQFSEIDWTAAADAGTIDWGEVQWNELDKADYGDISWNNIQFGELDGADISLIHSFLTTGEVNRAGTLLADNIIGDSSNNSIFGLTGSDIINGGSGNDILTGCIAEAKGGFGERDVLTGGTGNDVFVLGSEFGSLYDDGVSSNAGRNDYVLITDFTVGQDKLQLDGAASNYYIGASGVAGVSGTGLWSEQGATDELIAIMRSANTTQLNAANTVNTAQFI
jgi:Ca2+-binding RTX toxin-like protein